MSNSGGIAGPLTQSGNATGTPVSQDVNAIVYAFDNLSNTARTADNLVSRADGADGTHALSVGPYLFNGATFDRQRVPAVFKSATATAAGTTTLWTPAAGKKFRLMRYRIDVTNNASQAVAGTFFVRFTDSANDASIYHELFVPGAAGAVVGAYSTGWVDLGNGYLSLAANNVLQLSLQAALATGEVRASVCGTEE